MEEQNDSLNPQEAEIEYAFQPDDCYYGTGSTTPPKDHAGVVALVLVTLIFFCCILTSLSLLNIELFRERGSATELESPVRFSEEGGELAQGLDSSALTPPERVETIPSEAHLELEPSPQSQDHVVKVEGALPWQQVYEQVIDSVVSIRCTGYGSASTGTGVIMDKNGYIITNAHVVEDAQQIEVLLHDERTFRASCVGLDSVSDLAVLHISAEDLQPAQFGTSASLRVGDEVVAIGDPLGIELRGTMTDGIISGINRDLNVSGRTMTLLQTTAALNSGNSGGPLVNCYGQVIGINTMKIGDYASSAGVEGLGFAIPMTTVKNVVEQLLTTGYVAGRPSLGFNGKLVSNFYQIYYRLPAGLLIYNVDEGSYAHQIGIQTGDILTYLDDQRITDLLTLEQILYSYQAGDTVSAVIYRGGREYAINLTLGEDTGK